MSACTGFILLKFIYLECRQHRNNTLDHIEVVWSCPAALYIHIEKLWVGNWLLWNTVFKLLAIVTCRNLPTRYDLNHTIFSLDKASFVITTRGKNTIWFFYFLPPNIWEYIVTIINNNITSICIWFLSSSTFIQIWECSKASLFISLAFCLRFCKVYRPVFIPSLIAI